MVAWRKENGSRICFDRLNVEGKKERIKSDSVMRKTVKEQFGKKSTAGFSTC